jgi:predicted TIM-barrel fold metal-dependent hydrolase
MLWDVERRLKLLDAFGVEKQVVSVTQPSLDDMFPREEALALARLANDTLAEMLAGHEGRLLGLTTLSLDRPELEVFWEAAEANGVVLWLHPARTAARPDYVDETESKWRIYNVFGWPWDTTVAMVRLVLSGVMERHPNLRIIAHHGGALVPYFVGRIEKLYNHGGIRTPGGETVLAGLKRFYVDTCTWGSTAALLSTYAAFGPERMILGSDVPYGDDEGRDFLEETILSLRYLPVPREEIEAIAAGNLVRLVGLDGGEATGKA